MVAPSVIRDAMLLADPACHLGHLFGHRVFDQRHVDLHDPGQLGDVDEGVAEGARHLPVDHGDHGPRVLDRGLGGVDADPVGTESVLVGRRDVDQSDIDRHLAARDQGRDVVQVDGHEIGPPLVDRGADVGAGEERPVAEVALHPGRHVGRRGESQDVHDLDILEFRSASHHGIDEQGRRVAPGVDPHPVAGPDVLDRVLGSRHPFSEDTVPVHRAPSVAVD